MSDGKHGHPHAFVDNLLTEVPEFREIMETWRDSPNENLVDWYREHSTFALSDAGHWLLELKANGDAASVSLIKRICGCINDCAEMPYMKDDMRNNIQVCLFWLLDYDDIAFFKPYFSETVLALGREYLKHIDGGNYQAF
jgi:hypothetical protein